jgi:hypothetical protein
MTTDYRALCAELADQLETTIGFIVGSPMLKADASTLLNRVHAALAEKPQGPTDEELDRVFHEHCGGDEGLIETGFRPAARAVLARWGTVTPVVITIGPLATPFGTVELPGTYEAVMQVTQQRSNSGTSEPAVVITIRSTEWSYVDVPAVVAP